MYHLLWALLHIDITYFLELIGVTAYFTVSCVMYAVSLVSNLAAFPLIEVLQIGPAADTRLWDVEP
jgi:hypothetical protein